MSISNLTYINTDKPDRRQKSARDDVGLKDLPVELWTQIGDKVGDAKGAMSLRGSALSGKHVLPKCLAAYNQKGDYQYCGDGDLKRIPVCLKCNFLGEGQIPFKQYCQSHVLSQRSTSLTDLGGHQGLEPDTTAVAVMSDGPYIVTGSNRSAQLIIWDLKTGLPTSRGGEYNYKQFRSIVLTPDGTKAVATHDGGGVTVTELGHDIRPVLIRPAGYVSVVAVNPTGTQFVHSTVQGMWIRGMESPHTKIRRIQHDPVEHGNYTPLRISFTSDGMRVILLWWNGGGCVWKVRNRNLKKFEALQGQHNRYSISAGAVTPDGTRVIHATEEGAVYVWIRKLGELEYTLQLPPPDPSDDSFRVRFHPPIGARAVTVTPDGGYLVAGYKDGTTAVWNLGTGALERTLLGHRTNITSVATNGKVVVSGSAGPVRVWDIPEL